MRHPTQSARWYRIHTRARLIDLSVSKCLGYFIKISLFHFRYNAGENVIHLKIRITATPSGGRSGSRIWGKVLHIKIHGQFPNFKFQIFCKWGGAGVPLAPPPATYPWACIFFTTNASSPCSQCPVYWMVDCIEWEYWGLGRGELSA
jgi:hypothetical protein